VIYAQVLHMAVGEWLVLLEYQQDYNSIQPHSSLGKPEANRALAAVQSGASPGRYTGVSCEERR